MVVVINDRHRVIQVGVDPLVQALDVVIAATTARLSSLDATINTDITRTIEEKGQT